MKNIIYYLSTSIFIIIIFVSCTQNKMYRDNNNTCYTSEECTDNLIEIYNETNGRYDLTFVEFTERGNFFDRDKLKMVLEHIEDEEKKAKNGIKLFVYAHGWQHNADENDDNVEKVRELLRIMSQTKNNLSGKKVIGVYIGWRGLTLDIPLVSGLTYFGRKNVASQVGNGAVTELLLKLEKIVKQDSQKNDKDFKKKINEKANMFVVTGHSLGSDVILSSLKNILLERIINPSIVPYNECSSTLKNTGIEKKYEKYCTKGCKVTKNFADAVVLLNPAVEANELLQIKTLVAEERCYSRKQEKLLHILSSRADKVTNYAFPIGQWFGVSTNKSELNISRTIFNIDYNKSIPLKKKIILKEWELDITTVGNYQPFRTGKEKENFSYEKDTLDRCHGLAKCVDEDYQSSNFPVSPFEPISIISVDKSFIGEHNDIFNANVMAYISSAVLENQYKRYRYNLSEALPEDNKMRQEIASCYEKNEDGKEKFQFRTCGSKFYKLYKDDFNKSIFNPIENDFNFTDEIL